MKSIIILFICINVALRLNSVPLDYIKDEGNEEGTFSYYSLSIYELNSILF